MDICLIEKNLEEVELIKPLWEQLNAVHLEKSVDFKSRFENFTFEERMKSIYKKAQKGIIKLDMLQDRENGIYVGYCLSSIEDNLGEIESIFIESKYRKFRLGGKLMDSALAWFEANSTTEIQINVVYANDEAIPFYNRYGFYIGNYILKRK